MHTFLRNPRLATLLMVVAVAQVGASAPLVLAATPEFAWASIWDGPGSHDDEVSQAVADRRGGVILAGTSYLPDGSRSRYVTFVQRVDAEGGVDWVRIFDAEFGTEIWDFAEVGDGTGAVSLVYRSYPGDLQVAVLDGFGQDLWTASHPVPANLTPGSKPRLAMGPDARPIIGMGAADGVHLLVLGPTGALEREITVDLAGQTGYLLDLLVDQAGNIYLGLMLPTGTRGNSLAVLKVTPAGTVAWRQDTTGDLGSVFPHLGLALLPDGDVAVAGNPESICGVHRLATWRIAAGDGALLWFQVLGDLACDTFTFLDLAVSTAGDILVLGQGLFQEGDPETGAVVVKYDAQGARQWHRLVEGGLGNPDLPAELALARDGEVILAGRTMVSSQSSRAFTVGLAADGTQNWRHTWTRADGVSSTATAVAVSGAGEVFVGGMVHGPQPTHDAVALLYRRPIVSAAAPWVPDPGLRVRSLLNPFSGATRIRFGLARGASFTLSVHDVRGRLVRVLNRGVAPAGDHEVSWSGRDQQGRALPSGTYLLLLETSSGVATHPVTILR